MLEIKNLHVTHKGKSILKGVNLILEEGNINVLMGPNGSGKTTLAYVLMGNPKYKVTEGEILLNGKSILNLNVTERARKGIFLSFQNPVEISGVSVSNFLRQAYNSIKKEKLSILEFKNILEKKCAELGINPTFLSRSINEGFSGGEKKKAEILQMLVLNPEVIVLDEADSGLDIDSLKIVSKGISNFADSKKIIFIITHYKRLLDYIEPHKVFVLVEGKIVLEGNKDILDFLEKKGYNGIKKS